MGNLLYLVHRLPYPPDKGDKVRSYHLLKHLSARHRVFLGTFVDDAADAAHVDTVRALCADVRAVRLQPLLARLRSLRGFLSGEALSLPYYRDAALAGWLAATCRQVQIDAAVVFSSAMAPYLQGLPRFPALIDFVDVDSAKWSEYARRRSWPLSWLYRREGELLLAFERAAAARAGRSFFVTENEADLFRKLAPECAAGVEVAGNGVDADYFAPGRQHASPYAAEEIPVVFTGAMDYWPNADAAVWFAAEAMPRLAQRWPAARFYIVGRKPAPSVQALAGAKVRVTGTVPDVRPYLQHAAVVVAPLRVARGVQNKILEAMAMGRAVVASRACAGGVDATPGRDFLVADGSADFAAAVGEVLQSPQRREAIGAAARRRVLERYSWEGSLAGIGCHLESLAPAGA